MGSQVGRKAGWTRLPAALVVLLAGTGCGPATVPGASVAPGRVSAMLVKATDGDIEGLLRGERIQCEREGDGKLKLTLSGKIARLYLLDDGGSLLLRAFFKGRVSLEKLNRWNENARLLKAYVARDGDLAMESSLFLFGGVSRQAVPSFVRAFERDMLQLIGFLSE